MVLLLDLLLYLGSNYHTNSTKLGFESHHTKILVKKTFNLMFWIFSKIEKSHLLTTSITTSTVTNWLSILKWVVVICYVLATYRWRYYVIGHWWYYVIKRLMENVRRQRKLLLFQVVKINIFLTSVPYWQVEPSNECWNSNSSTPSNTLDFLWTPSGQQAHELFVWISLHNHSHYDLNIYDRYQS